jgi:hypothetical protein
MSPGASDEERLRLVVRALAASILACLAFSGKLWLSARLYPLVPVLGVVPPFPWPLDLFVLALLVGLLVGLVARPLSWPLAAAVVGLFALLFAQDQSRLWPSFYQFFLLLLLLLAHRPGGGEPAAARTLHGMRFVLAAVYFWGGVQKLTPHFFREEFPWFIRPLTDLLPFEVPGLPVLGMAAAVGEALVGIGLLTRRFRGLALGEALLMHAVILVCIGPLRGDWNDSAWIWSQSSAVLVWLLFRGAAPFRFATLFAVPPARSLAPGGGGAAGGRAAGARQPQPLGFRAVVQRLHRQRERGPGAHARRLGGPAAAGDRGSRGRRGRSRGARPQRLGDARVQRGHLSSPARLPGPAGRRLPAARRGRRAARRGGEGQLARPQEGPRGKLRRAVTAGRRPAAVAGRGRSGRIGVGP